MKKIFTLLVVLLLSSFLFASFSFSLGPSKPLFHNYESDNFSPRTKIALVYQTASNPEGQILRFDQYEGEYDKDLAYRDPNKTKENLLIQFQIGTAASLLRFKWDNIITFDAAAEAGFNTVCSYLNGNDFIGWDGLYFLGGEAKILNSVLFKAGFRHFSSHIADEVLIRTIQRNPGTFFKGPLEYVRDTIEISLGYENEKFPYISGAGSIIIPLTNSFMEPFAHRPDNIISDGRTNAEKEPELYAVRGDYGSWYKALILQGEIKGQYSINKALDVYMILGGKLHQDGCTKHTLDPSDDDKKWEAEFDAVLGLALKGDNLNVAAEFSYHNGRYPLLGFFWKRSQYISVGFRIY